MQSHAEGPREDDLVIVTEEKVVRALVDGKLDSGTAEKTGLLRFYGNRMKLRTCGRPWQRPTKWSRRHYRTLWEMKPSKPRLLWCRQLSEDVLTTAGRVPDPRCPMTPYSRLKL